MGKQILIVATLCIGAALQVTAQPLYVYADMSLAEVMPGIAGAFEKTHPGVNVKFTYAATGVLQTDITRGRQCDVFIAATDMHMNELQRQGLIDGKARHNACGNELLLVAPEGSTLHDWNELTGSAIKHIAMGDPDFDASGMYGKQALSALGLWQPLRGKLIFVEHSRQALSYVEGNHVDAAIVFLTDQQHSPHVELVASAPGDAYSTIRYPAAVTTNSQHAALARTFVDYLVTDDVQNMVQSYGFTLGR